MAIMVSTSVIKLDLGISQSVTCNFNTIYTQGLIVMTFKTFTLLSVKRNFDFNIDGS